MADRAAYKPIEYANAEKKGPQLVVLPGDVKSTNATFTQRFLPSSIADFAELELSRANFGVLERSDLGGLMREFELAYNLGDPAAARGMLQRGKLIATRWVVKFDVLKAEPVAAASQGFDGRADGEYLRHPRWREGRTRRRYGHRVGTDGRSFQGLDRRHALQDSGREDHGAGRDRLRRAKNGNRLELRFGPGGAKAPLRARRSTRSYSASSRLRCKRSTAGTNDAGALFALGDLR